ncbi:UNVERIFIED_CONTAM: hypothetical protein GTU68_039503 [Idotea baltica]|nr:hypothetical protein [Idotea baltica]
MAFLLRFTIAFWCAAPKVKKRTAAVDHFPDPLRKNQPKAKIISVAARARTMAELCVRHLQSQPDRL